MSASAQRFDTHVMLRFDYNPDAISALKRTVPYGARAWSPEAKQWKVEEPYVDDALRMLRNYVGPVRVADLRTGRKPPKPAPLPAPDWAQALRDALPVRLHAAAYKAMQRVVHPDMGGDVRLAQQLNAAFAESRLR